MELWFDAKVQKFCLPLQRMQTTEPVNNMLNKHQIEPLSWYICNGSGANVPLLFPLVKEKSSWVSAGSIVQKES